MKITIFILILAGIVAHCDDNVNYYVIQLPEDRVLERPFQVYWNVPTIQCNSKKVPFDNLEQFGIIQNKGDSFRGNKIAILYDPGLFPALLKNETSGKFKFRNGGVPQEGNLNLHLDVFKETVLQSIPDQDFDGVAVIDFESWRPILRQNFGELSPYKDVSYEIERKKHKWWLEAWIKDEAKSRFESSGRIFMQNTISLAKRLRPKAKWGYYGFPYCYNMASDRKEDCSDVTRTENDKSYWLWAESSVLFPSLYSSKALTTSQMTSLVRGRVKEASRNSRNGMILPYVWFRYRDGGFLSQNDLSALLDTLYKSEATGFIIWGSSHDVNTYDKCKKLNQYIYNTYGPAIANYTKLKTKIDINILNDTPDNVVFEVESTDPEYNWVPPVNYTQDLEKYVNDEFKESDDMPDIEKEASLIDFINNMYEKARNITEVTSVNITQELTPKDDLNKSLETVFDINSNKSFNNESTQNPAIETTTVTESYMSTTDSDMYTTLPDETTENIVTTTEDYNSSNYNNAEFGHEIIDYQTEGNFEENIDFTSTTIEPENLIGIIEEATINNDVSTTETTTEMYIDEYGTKTEDFKQISAPQVSTLSTSSRAATKHNFLVCVFVYLYSVTKCMCDFYNQC